MKPLLLIRETYTYAKVRCYCTREFWSPKGIPAGCLSCGIIWDGTYLKYAKVLVQHKFTEDYVTIMIGFCTTPAAMLAQMINAGPTLFAQLAGVKVQEITREEYDSTRLENVDFKFKALLSFMEQTT